jgi:hypothetical protein
VPTSLRFEISDPGIGVLISGDRNVRSEIVKSGFMRSRSSVG